MLSSRGAKSAASLDVPWRFAPGSDNRYDKITNPGGVVTFGSASNVRDSLESNSSTDFSENLMLHELKEYVNKNVSQIYTVSNLSFLINSDQT